MISKLKELILEILFPRFCFGCQREGEYLCIDCRATLDFTTRFWCLCENPQQIKSPGKCKNCQSKNLDGLYFPFSYQIPLIKELIHYFKYPPFVKDLAKVFSGLIKDYFFLLEEKPDLSDFLVLPLPLTKKRLKWRGYNQARELALYFSREFSLEMRDDILIKIKETLPQTELNKKERKENIRGAFLIKNKSVIKNRKILLIDDVYTTGATLEEAAKTLKGAGAQKVFGLVIARE